MSVSTGRPGSEIERGEMREGSAVGGVLISTPSPDIRSAVLSDTACGSRQRLAKMARGACANPSCVGCWLVQPIHGPGKYISPKTERGRRIRSLRTRSMNFVMWCDQSISSCMVYLWSCCLVSHAISEDLKRSINAFGACAPVPRRIQYTRIQKALSGTTVLLALKKKARARLI